MTSTVSTIGRDLAPHLKILMGPWWFSQFDPVSEVSQAAKRSLQAAFPSPEKRLDAIKLCATEIFMYLEENLKFTPQSNLVIITGFGVLLDVLMDSQSEKPESGKLASEPEHASKARVTAMSYGEKLFSNNKYFLEFLKASSPMIRSSAYSVLRSYVKNIPHLFNEENMKATTSSILGSFQEKDPLCHSLIWDIFLLFTKRFPESWNLLNVQKVILNRLWHYLRNGCFGSQHVAYPALVIFLHTLPPKSVSGEQFFLDFFQNLWAGRNSSITVNRDRQLFFQSFKECFLWALNNGLRFVKEDAVNHFQAYILFGDEEYLYIFKEAYGAAMHYLFNDPWYVEVNMDFAAIVWPLFNSLQAFWPGLQVLAGDLDPAIGTHSAFFSVWKRYGFTPEGFNLATLSVQHGQKKLSFAS